MKAYPRSAAPPSLITDDPRPPAATSPCKGSILKIPVITVVAIISEAIFYICDMLLGFLHNAIGANTTLNIIFGMLDDILHSRFLIYVFISLLFQFGTPYKCMFDGEC